MHRSSTSSLIVKGLNTHVDRTLPQWLTGIIAVVVFLFLIFVAFLVNKAWFHTATVVGQHKILASSVLCAISSPPSQSTSDERIKGYSLRHPRMSVGSEARNRGNTFDGSKDLTGNIFKHTVARHGFEVHRVYQTS
uniref:Uncharacterized protein n=1 Tax=Oncorhynchus mykiss TaxID=8022 RepID=A0A8K9UZ67_ONCMY